MKKNIMISFYILAFLLSINTSSFPQVRLKWIFKTSLPITANPIVEDGVVYVTTSGSTYPVDIFSVDTNTGKAILHGETLCHAQWSHTVSKGVIYFGNDSQDFLALDAHTFEEKWRFQTHGQTSNVFSYPTVNDGIVYFGCVDDGLYAVDIHTGRELWRFATKLDRYLLPYLFNPPVVSNGLVFYASADSFLHVIEARSGTLVHNIRSHANISSIPVIDDCNIYVGCRDHYLYAFDKITYEEKWKFGIGTAVIHGRPTVIGKIIYFVISDGHFYAMDVNSRKVLWQYKAGGAITSSPTIVDHVAYFCSWDCYLYAINIQTGDEIWRYKAGGPILSSPSVVDGVVYFGSRDHNLYALEVPVENYSQTLSNYSELAGTKIGNVTDVAFDSKGHIFVATYGNGIFCIRDNTVEHFTANCSEPFARASYSLSDTLLYHRDIKYGRVWVFPLSDSNKTLASNNVYTLAVGPQDIIFAATDGGLSYYSGGVWQTIIENDVFTSVVILKNTIWAATSREIWKIEFSKKQNSLKPSLYDKYPWITAIAMDNKNQLWIYSCMAGAGLFVVDSKGEATNIESFPFNYIYQMDFDEQNRLWAATETGVICFMDGKSDQSVPRLLPSDGKVLTINAKLHGQIWIGTTKGVAWLNDAYWEHLDTEAGLQNNVVHRIRVAPSGEVYACTLTGFSVLRGFPLLR